MTNGLYAIKRSIGGILEIHNTGGYTYKDIDGNDKYAKSIIKEHAINGKYIFDDIPDEFNSVYIHA